eukprot:TRINITY_DN8946_c0_g1_i2.p1 TRINITY_DN8946_c0_g1~~TRINITY_DN8946_c0_g1_i2.p1  ORF type:complete len:905 (+),score=262.09 TRINITY_DN8946_c0_g1_i2:96-2810(+)
MPSLRLGGLLGSFAVLFHVAQAQIMSIDLGNEFFKVALMRQGVPLEIVLNPHSKRKSLNAVSFKQASRVFGDDCAADLGKAPKKVPIFYHSLLGQNFTDAKDVAAGGAWWKAFGLDERFYSYDLGYDAERGVPTFKLGDDLEVQGEEALASLISFAKKMSEESADGKAVRECIITVPSHATLRQRQAIINAGEIAGLRVSLVHETSAFAVQRAVDITPEKNASDVYVFYNFGSRKVEVSVVKFESRNAGMVAGKMAPVVTVLGSAVDYSVGGHLLDLRIADAMLKKFLEKFPKLADGIAKDSRAMRKLLTQAQKTKAILSSNKVAPFTVESLFQDTDFQTTIKREEFEDMCKDMFEVMTAPIEKALNAANVTLADVKFVEVVGGAWRVPKVQELLSSYVKSGDQSLPLGQHLNGEEAGAMGAALIAANASRAFRVKKIFFADFTNHEYAVQVAALDGSWEKNLTALYPVGASFGGKKKLSFTLEEDFMIKLFEDGVLVSEYAITGLKDLLDNKWKDYNTTGPPKITASVPLDGSGIIEVGKPVVTIEELYWVNVTKEKPKPNITKPKEGTSNTSNDSAESNESETEESTSEDGNETSNATEEPEFELKQKKKKHQKDLNVTRADYRPKPLSEEQIKKLQARLHDMAAKEEEVAAMAGLKNELEAYIYGSRDKLEREDIVKVSTDAQREEVTKMCAELEDFMYETGTSKSDYDSRLKKLQDLMQPMEERALEFEARADLPDNVKEELSSIKDIQAHIAKNMTWVSKNKTEAAEEKLSEFQAWWAKKQESQKSLPLSEAPAYTKQEVMDQLSKVRKDWDKLRKIKKPKETKPKSDKNATNSTSKDKKTEVPMPTDVEGIENELASIKEKKMDAVEKEDFDAAHVLKQREQALMKELEKVKAEKSEL